MPVKDVLLAVLKNVVLPEVLAAIRAHRNATGELPTDEQVFAALDLHAMEVRAQGQGFLDATRPTMP